MSTHEVYCDATACLSFEKIVQLLLSERYSGVLDEYCFTLEEFPDYLSYHSMSTALRLQFELKLNDLPWLKIGGCTPEIPGGCCLVDALKEAIRRRKSVNIDTGSAVTSVKSVGRVHHPSSDKSGARILPKNS